jgi:hypothetical protein
MNEERQPPNRPQPKYPPETWSIERPHDYSYLSRPPTRYQDEDNLGDGATSAEDPTPPPAA